MMRSRVMRHWDERSVKAAIAAYQQELLELRSELQEFQRRALQAPTPDRPCPAADLIMERALNGELLSDVLAHCRVCPVCQGVWL
jgi:hypothetical protein